MSKEICNTLPDACWYRCQQGPMVIGRLQPGGVSWQTVIRPLAKGSLAGLCGSCVSGHAWLDCA